MKIKSITINDDLKPTWDIEVPDGNEYILGNGCVSHNTSGIAINATESIEPIQNTLFKQEGTINVTSIVPNFRKHNKHYKRAMECDQYKLVELAAIRQMYLDQGQSVNLYFPRPDSFAEMMRLHLYFFSLGGKTLYYLKSLKGGDDEVCESCS